MGATKIKQIKSLQQRIKKQLTAHLLNLGLINKDFERLPKSGDDKSTVRQFHRAQRVQKQAQAADFVRTKFEKHFKYFASGNEVDPSHISPRLEIVSSGTVASDLFRLAILTWSVPVSEGYGRRMRFLVWDDNNGKLIGVMALGDPVFNLGVRDQEIGWNAADRKLRLVNLMDAYVLGAIPPYNMLLCGKLVACLVRTKEVRDCFRKRYGNCTGLISGEEKNAHLVMASTSSALGRSSVYNRLSLGGKRFFSSIGYTAGYGHFHVPNDIFEDICSYLRLVGHNYVSGNRFGDGPNWRFRAIRAALELIGFDREVLKHGIKREVFLCRLANNADRVLRGENVRAMYGDLQSVEDVSELALERWIRPRSMRRHEYLHWESDEIRALVNATVSERQVQKKIR